MKVLALFFLLLVAAVVFGGIGYFSYTMFVSPAKAEKADRAQAAEAAAVPQSTPEPGLDAFESAMTLVPERARIFDAIAALEQFTTTYPNSSVISEAKAALGELNSTVVFTTVDSPAKLAYTVVSGDSLARIAGKTNSSAELILRSNNLTSIDLQIGQVLRIPQMNTAIVVDRATSTLTLFNNNVFFKEYPLIAQVPGSGGVDTTVKEKIAVRDGKRVIFGGVDYPSSERSIILEQNAPAIRGGADGTSGGGIMVSQYDIEEIFPLVTRGTRVIIR